MSVGEPEAGPRTRAEWAEDHLRRAIITGDLAPGERVFVEQLSATWRLSATPLREALRTLAGQGLIVLDAQRGARVAKVSVDEMMEVYELRLIVEPLRAPSVDRGRRAGLARRARERLEGAAPGAQQLPEVADRSRAGAHRLPRRARRRLWIRPARSHDDAPGDASAAVPDSHRAAGVRVATSSRRSSTSDSPSSRSPGRPTTRPRSSPRTCRGRSRPWSRRS